jgi:hypothetical protein
MYIRDRKEREEYMDDLERQMEDQREQIQRTLDGMEGSGRRGRTLERLRRSLPYFPGRGRGRGNPEEASAEAPESPESPGPTVIPTDAGGGPEMPAERPEERSRWRRMFGE